MTHQLQAMLHVTQSIGHFLSPFKSTEQSKLHFTMEI